MGLEVMDNPLIEVTSQDVRDFANFPSEVPDSLLDRHIKIAVRDLIKRIGVNQSIDSVKEDWVEAIIVRALASAFPWLNTFALDGAAKVGALDGNVEYRFLDSDDVDAKINKLMKRYDELASRIQQVIVDDDDTGFGTTTLIAI